MSFFEAISLGLIEGFTEFLPVSSTAHLILFSKIFNLEQSEFLKTFIIFIQSGAVLGLLFLYWRSLVFDLKTLKKVIIAFLPTAIIGFLLYKIIKSVFFDSLLLILTALFVGGVLMIIFEIYYQKYKFNQQKKEKIFYKEAFLIGLGQSLAVIPGVSRSGTTILTGLLMNLERRSIVEFSFLLSIPTIIMATFYDLYKNFGEIDFTNFYLLIIGFFVSLLSAILSAKFFLNYISKHSFTIFGIYRILLAIVLAFYFLGVL